MISQTVVLALSGLGADDVIAKTLYAEARGEGRRGLEYVASVINNRGVGDAEKCVEACLRPYQFSCWNGKSDIEVNRDSKEWELCLDFQTKIEAGTFKSITEAKHYYSSRIRMPKWARGKKSILVGKHYFVMDVK